MTLLYMGCEPINHRCGVESGKRLHRRGMAYQNCGMSSGAHWSRLTNPGSSARGICSPHPAPSQTRTLSAAERPTSGRCETISEIGLVTWPPRRSQLRSHGATESPVRAPDASCVPGGGQSNEACYQKAPESELLHCHGSASTTFGHLARFTPGSSTSERWSWRHMSRGSGLLAYFACARQPLALAPLPWGGRL